MVYLYMEDIFRILVGVFGTYTYPLILNCGGQRPEIGGLFLPAVGGLMNPHTVALVLLLLLQLLLVLLLLAPLVRFDESFRSC